MPDLVPALAERLRVIMAKGQSPLVVRWEDAENVARAALTVVAERLPTRGEISEIIVRAFLPYGVVYDSADEDYRDMADLVWKAADALLRDWRERLGVKP